MADDQTQEAIDSALKALDRYREEKNAKGMIESLDTLIDAYALKKQANKGFRTALKELEHLRTREDRYGEVGLLEMLMHAHARLGEPVSSKKYATEALDQYRSMGDKAGEASILHTMSEMDLVLGDMAAATRHSQAAVKIFNKIGDKDGADRAKYTYSKVLGDRGFSDQAPKKNDALMALARLAKAVETRDKDALIKAEAEVDKLSSLIEDGDIEGVLHAAILKDPANAEFLEEQGWTIPKQTEPTHIKQYSQQAFYLQSIMGGMGFGPEFRIVNPHKLNNESPFGHKIAIGCNQQCETEAWEMELGYRPGILDGGLQHLGVVGWP